MGHFNVQFAEVKTSDAARFKHKAGSSIIYSAIKKGFCDEVSFGSKRFMITIKFNYLIIIMITI